MNIKEIINSGLLDRYVIGDVTGDEINLVEKALQDSPELRQVLTQTEETIQRMSQENAIDPPRGAKDIIMDRIDKLSSSTTSITYSKPYTFWKRWALIAASVAALLGIGLASLMDTQKSLKNEVNDLKEQYIDLSKRCDEQQEVSEKDQKRLNLIQDPQTKLITLNAIQGNSIQAYAYWNKNSEQALIHLSNLPPLPGSEVYQLWADIDGEMISMAVLSNSTQEVPFMGAAESLNITIEPRGGSDQPNVNRLIVSGKV